MELKKHKIRGMSILTLLSSLLIGGFSSNRALQAEIVVAGNADAIAPDIIDLHKALCRVAKANKQPGKNVLVFMGQDGVIHTILSGKENILEILGQNGKTKEEYIQFVSNILRQGELQQPNSHHGNNDYFHTEMLLAYVIIKNLKIDGFPCGLLLEQDLHVCSYKDMCPNCETVLKHLSAQLPGTQIFISSLEPYEFNGSLSRNGNDQFGNLKITDNFFRIAFYDAPEEPLPIDWKIFS
jgi:hypothetical protein